MSIPSFEDLKQQFQRQNSDLTHIEQVLSSLGPNLGLAVDEDWFSALDDALEGPVAASAPPPLGQRA